MQGFLANSVPAPEKRPAYLAGEAVRHADALLAELGKTQEKDDELD